MRNPFKRKGEPEAARVKTGAAPDSPAAKPSPASPATHTAGQPAQTDRPATPEERIDGLRARIAQVDRKLSIRSYGSQAVGT